MRKLLKLVFILLIYVIFIFTVLNVLPGNVSASEYYLIISFVNIVVAFFIMNNNRSYEDKSTWLLMILLLPGLGLLFYWLFGLDYRYTNVSRNTFTKERLDKALQEPEYPFGFKSLLEDELDFIQLIAHLSASPIYFYNETKLLNNGDEKFPELFKDLLNAKNFIHMEYFIIKNSQVASELKEILIKKAAEGVEVRILLDAFGAMKLKKKYIRELRSHGIKVAFFNKLSYDFLRDGLNYRNHRKIVVIDSKIGYTGGINISDEYLHKDKYYGFWRDTHLKIVGDGIVALHKTFITDWYNVTKEDLLNEKYLETHSNVYNASLSGIQFIEDGPDIQRTIIKDIYFKGIMEAQKHIRIATPYLIPNTEIVQALKVASMSGVKVDILLPGKPDKRLVYCATKSYISELISAGVNIYFYRENFMHSKIMVIDDRIASLGTVNFDFRSFNLHFENTAVLYLDKTIKNIITTFEDDLRVSRKVDIEIWNNRPFYKKILQTLARLFSPLF